MRNRFLENLNRIEFVVTSACTGKCRHCSQGDHNENESISAVLAEDVVRCVASQYEISSVMTFGGEALLYSDTVCRIHRAAREMGIPKRQLITNGYFTRLRDKTESVAEALIESGVNEILVSVDAFHQETIPVECVEAFIKAVNREGVTVKTQPAWLVSQEDENEYNIRTRDLLEYFKGLGIEAGEGNVVFPCGNALKNFREYFDDIDEFINPYKENPFDVRAICISANGDLLGDNIYKSSIADILYGYNPE